jgi:hypothetical protein
MANHDAVVADENVLDDEAHDALALDDVKRVGSATQSGEKRRESFGEAQERSPVCRLVGDRLQLATQCLFALPKRRHALAQLLERQELLLVGDEESFDAFANAGEFAVQALLALLGRIRCARCSETPVKFLLDQRRVLEQADHLCPDDLVEQILPHHAVIAHRTAELSPTIRANAFVITAVQISRDRV